MAEVRGRDAFLKTDLAAMLQAVLDTNEQLAGAFPLDHGVQMYRAGFAAAVQAMAVAIGAERAVLTTDQRTARRMDQWVASWEVRR